MSTGYTGHITRFTTQKLSSDRVTEWSSKDSAEVPAWRQYSVRRRHHFSRRQSICVLNQRHLHGSVLSIRRIPGFRNQVWKQECPYFLSLPVTKGGGGLWAAHSLSSGHRWNSEGPIKLKATDAAWTLWAPCVQWGSDKDRNPDLMMGKGPW